MPSVCLGVSEARAWVHVAHAVEYRIFLAVRARRTSPSGSSRPSRAGTGRRPSRSASGVTIWKGLYGPYAALARNLSSATAPSKVQGR